MSSGKTDYGDDPFKFKSRLVIDTNRRRGSLRARHGQVSESNAPVRWPSSLPRRWKRPRTIYIRTARHTSVPHRGRPPHLCFWQSSARLQFILSVEGWERASALFTSLSDVWCRSSTNGGGALWPWLWWVLLPSGQVEPDRLQCWTFNI